MLEAIAAYLMAFYWIQSAHNLSDMLCGHPSVYQMILKLLITRGNIVLIPKEATEEKENENYIMEKEEERKNKNQKNIKKENE